VAIPGGSEEERNRGKKDRTAGGGLRPKDDIFSLSEKKGEPQKGLKVESLGDFSEGNLLKRMLRGKANNGIIQKRSIKKPCLVPTDLHQAEEQEEGRGKNPERELPKCKVARKGATSGEKATLPGWCRWGPNGLRWSGGTWGITPPSGVKEGGKGPILLTGSVGGMRVFTRGWRNGT